MVEYVTFSVLYLHRKIRAYEASQARQEWAPLVQPAASGVRVGIMGVGVLGKACGLLLQRIGFKVAGWARTTPATYDFPMFAGQEGLPAFLERTDILVSLLPNTASTEGLIGRSIFESLSRSGNLEGPFFVNGGRGEVVRQHDLIDALRDGTLAGAVLDVFDSEPLARDSPLWSMPNVLITPHVAADSDPDVVVTQILEDVQRIESGQPLESLVDLARGY
nr:NAD(P)-dependent oxidoreductase [Burkholderia diffusa]